MNLQNVLDQTIAVIVVIVFGTMLLGYVLGLVNTMYAVNMARIFGYRRVTLTGIIGTPIHELGHYIMCKVFRVKVVDVKLLNLDDNSDVLGYVRYEYNKLSIYQNMARYFIAVGPLYLGSILVLILTRIAMKDTYLYYMKLLKYLISNNSYNLFDRIYTLVTYTLKELYRVENFKSIGFWIFIMVATTISLHSDLSSQDIKNSIRSSIYLSIVVFIVNLIGMLIKIRGYTFTQIMVTIGTAVLGIISILLVFSLIALIFSIILRILFRK